MTRSCNVCQRSYMAKRSSSKFCSDLCRKRAQRGLGAADIAAPGRGYDTTATPRNCDVCHSSYGAKRPNSKYCSGTCRKRAQRGARVPVPRVAATPRPPRIRRPDALCNRCGKKMWSDRNSLPADQRRCQPCRRIDPQLRIENPRTTCVFCSADFQPKRSRGGFTKTCSKSCAQWLRVGRVPGDSHPGRNAARAALEKSAPGLSRNERIKLMRVWMSQDQACAYCVTRSGTTVDHVVPLSRGGTNFVGNLVPACRPCNSSKGLLLVMEWRARNGSQLQRVPVLLRGEAA